MRNTMTVVTLCLCLGTLSLMAQAPVVGLQSTGSTRPLPQPSGITKSLALITIAGEPLSRDDVAARILPLASGLSTHDPTIVRDGSWYYRFSTGIGVSVARSSDLLHWDYQPPAFASPPVWSTRTIPAARDFWAPEVVQRQGKFWLYYSVSSFGSNQSAIGLAVATTLDPDKPGSGWTDQGLVLQSNSNDDFNAIDANVVTDREGGLWLVYGSFWSGIKMSKLDPTSGKLDTHNPQLHNLAQRPHAPDAIEGAYILPHGHWYYLFVSFDFCCKGRFSTYKIAVGRSDTITGPYVDRAGVPLLQGGGTILRQGDSRDAGMGHNSILVDGERSLIVYHAYDLKYGGQARLRIEQLLWDDQEWPLMPSALLADQP